MISSLLTPIDVENKWTDSNHFFNVVYSNDLPFEGFRGPGIALISLGSIICDPIRKTMRSLYSHFKNIQTYDLGYLQEISDENIQTIISMCSDAGVVPIFTGFMGSEQFMTKMTRHDYVVSNLIPAGIKDCNYIAYQRHLCRHEDIFVAEQYRHNTISLGKMRSNPVILEPALRDIDILYIDLQAVRSSDAPNVKMAYPTGLYAEELCQILKYAGTGCRIRGVFFQSNLSGENYTQEAILIAESIWYLAEGIDIKIDDHPEKTSDHTRFIIHAQSVDEDLEFFKHNQTGKWWLKHPSDQLDHQYLACSYEEYQSSIGDELPERVYKFVNETPY